MIKTLVNRAKTAVKKRKARKNGGSNGSRKVKNPFKHIQKIYNIQSHFYDALFGRIFDPGRRGDATWRWELDR